MGTRNLTCVYLDGKYGVAQYGQWDGYPAGQGMTVLEFLKNEMNRETFIEKVRACRFINKEEREKLWIECGANPQKNGVSMEESKIFEQKHPHLHRNTAAGVLKLIQDSENGLPLNDELAFAGDSLFCEWCYVVDLDKNAFEVFKGWNKDPLQPDDRFCFLPVDGDEYKQVKLVASYSLDALPSDDQFLKLDQDDDSLITDQLLHLATSVQTDASI